MLDDGEEQLPAQDGGAHQSGTVGGAEDRDPGMYSTRSLKNLTVITIFLFR